MKEFYCTLLFDVTLRVINNHALSRLATRPEKRAFLGIVHFATAKAMMRFRRFFGF